MRSGDRASWCGWTAITASLPSSIACRQLPVHGETHEAAKVDRFLSGKPNLEQAYDWLDQAAAAPATGPMALLQASGPTDL
jgi:hypothetical protein